MSASSRVKMMIDASTAEALALRWALKLAIQFGFSGLHVESDSLIVT